MRNTSLPKRGMHRRLTQVDARVILAGTMRRTVMLLTLIVAVLGAGARAAVTSPVQRGATYDGRGRQPRFLLPPGRGGPDGSFILRLRVASSGRRVERVDLWGLPVACSRSSYTDAMAQPGSAGIRRDGTFRASLTAAGGTALTLAGRFLPHGHARGTFHYRGRGPLTGCNADGIWTAQVKPPPPPVQQFVGTTDEGTRVTFERTIERHPHVTRFDFGLLQTNCMPLKVATGPELGPPFDEFALPVHNNRFSGDYFDEAYDITITGSFGAKNRASGTVSFVDRGDCHTGGVRWTAHA